MKDFLSMVWNLIRAVVYGVDLIEETKKAYAELKTLFGRIKEVFSA